MSYRTKKRLAALLALAMAAVMLLSAGFTTARGRVTLTGGGSETEYELYTCDEACFSLEYPAGGEVSEPYDNGVFITVADGFHLAAEYAYSLNDEMLLYSAADMASLIAADEDRLTLWTGADELDVVETGKMNSPAGQCYRFDYVSEVGGEPWSGCLVIFDGQGEFGCYCLQALIRDDDDSEAHWDQFDHVFSSFRITDAYQLESMTLYEVPDWEMEFLVHDEYLDDIEYTDDPIGQSLRLQPAGATMSQGSILIDKLTFGPDEDLEDIMNESLDFILSNKEDAEVIAEPDTEDLIGRNPAGIFIAGYIDRGAPIYTVHAYIGSDDGWWSMIGNADEDHLEAVMTIMSDLMVSMRFGGDSGDNVKVNKSVAAILDRLEDQDGFQADGYLIPRASVTDVNGDGRWEFLAVYKIDSSVMYDVWSIREGGAQLLDHGELYVEAGASMGTLFLYEKDGVDYLCKWTGIYDDEDSYTSRSQYIPLSEDEGELLFDEALTLEVLTPADSDESEYYVNGKEASESAYSSQEDQFELLVVLNWFGGAFAAPGDETTPYDSMMTFDEMRQHDFGC